MQSPKVNVRFRDEQGRIIQAVEQTVLEPHQLLLEFSLTMAALGCMLALLCYKLGIPIDFSPIPSLLNILS